VAHFLAHLPAADAERRLRRLRHRLRAVARLLHHARPPVLIEQQVREALNWPFAAALSAVLLAATLAVYGLAQRGMRAEHNP
jgi:hypothetical protein